ncbi:Dabb family protein [Microbacterium betulae]|uniref:Dabb family protein n=1 Tax=Microbacterium betulae TaxID=2981139 RepID=A0AA97I7M0_9MICO|nr:Dabb family protein [Microbacterium sp. AB]WOF23595.1 Dabb family protein [Microbacterium sp. AB]
MAIRHIVLFQLAATDEATREEHAAEAKRRLEALVGVVPDLLDLTVSRNVAYEGSNFDIVLESHFPDVAALEAYQVHPAHVETASFIGTIRSGRAAIDFEV